MLVGLYAVSEERAGSWRFVMRRWVTNLDLCIIDALLEYITRHDE